MRIPANKRALSLLERLGPDAQAASIREIQDRYDISHHAARIVRRVLCGQMSIDDLRKAVGAEGDDVVPNEEPPKQGSYTELDDGRYIFEWSDGTVRRSAILTEDELKSMVRAYVSTHQGGEGRSMHEVAVRHRLTRRDFWHIKSIYGLTKQHEPFTTRELRERPEEDLLDDQLALRRERLIRRFETEDLAQLKRLAGKWLALQAGTLDPLREVVEAVVGHAPPEKDEDPWNLDSPTNGESYIALYQGSDLHYGLNVDSRFSQNEVYNRRIARARFLTGLHETIEHGCRAYGAPPEYVLLYVGGDISHVDNIHSATSSMRHHQDMDGIPETLPQEITEMYIEAVDGLLQKGLKVYLTCVPGNHDEMMSRQMYVALWAAYRDHPDVRWGNASSSHAFVLYGDTAIVGHHGHGESKAVDLGATLESWLREKGHRARHRYAVTGNLHHLMTKEANGTILIQQPSPAASDRYHKLNGYDKSRAAVIGMYFGPEDGLLGIRYVGF